MNEEQISLARRAVACRGWKWMSGMATDEGHRVVLVDTDIVWMVYEGEGKCKPGCVEDFAPDLTDPATLGCLLALVREAWGDEVMTCARVDVFDDYIAPLPGGYPYGVLREGRRRAFKYSFASEAEALVAALEAAP